MIDSLPLFIKKTPNGTCMTLHTVLHSESDNSDVKVCSVSHGIELGV